MNTGYLSQFEADQLRNGALPDNIPTMDDFNHRMLPSFLQDVELRKGKDMPPESLYGDQRPRTGYQGSFQKGIQDMTNTFSRTNNPGMNFGSLLNPVLDVTSVVGGLGLGIWQNINQGTAIANQDRQFEENLGFRKEQTDRMWQAARAYGLASPFQATSPARINASGSNDGFVNLGNYATQMLSG